MLVSPNLGVLLHRKITPCLYCGVTLDQCACTDDPGDSFPRIEFEQVEQAIFWPSDLILFQHSCYEAGEEAKISLATCKFLWPLFPGRGYL